MNYIRRKFQVGKDEVFRVINVDQKKGYIDLSIKGVKAGIEQRKKDMRIQKRWKTSSKN